MIVIIMSFVYVLWLTVPAVRMDVSSPEGDWGKENNICARDVIERYSMYSSIMVTEAW